MAAQSAPGQQHTCELIDSDKETGTPIYCVDGAELGRIDRLMIDKSTGKVVYAVMSREGAEGNPSNRYPLPWSLLAPRPARDGYEAEITEQELKGAPKFCSTESWDWASRERGQFVHDYYNVPPYWGL